ncbi:MAG: hypothetical protein JO057_04855, partial [Chloroflexi bacterium]|nr:hypothetical protein [Chloroflexota bacterium]
DPPRDFRLGPALLADPPQVVRLRRWYAVGRIAAASLAALFVVLSSASLYLETRPRAPEPSVSTEQTSSTPTPTGATPLQRLAVPAAAQRAAPAAAGAAAAAGSAPATPRPEAPVAAATSRNPSPADASTTGLPAPTSGAGDPAAPWRTAAIGVGLLAVVALLATVVARQRLRRVTSHS